MKYTFRNKLFNNLKPSQMLFVKQLSLWALFACTWSLAKAQPYNVNVTTTATSPANKSIKDYVLSGRITSGFTFTPLPSDGSSGIPAAIYGKVTSSSSNLTIITTQTNLRLVLPRNSRIDLNPMQLFHAFGDFNPNNINISGGPPGIDPNNIKLPDGNYQICFWAVRDSCVVCNDLSNPNSGCASFSIACNPINGVQITTNTRNPVNPFIVQAIQSGDIISAGQYNTPVCDAEIKLFGKVERISPSPFSIELNSKYQQQAPVTINPGITQLTPSQLLGAFNNFNESDLIVTGVNLASIKDANNRIKLPDGNYRICFYALYVDPNGGLGNYASNPNLGCGSFTICNKAGNAPQFTQPVNNLNINSDISIVQPVSPVIFSWTPPQSTCGLPSSGYSYDLEIWELYPNQTVTDAVNNPYTFHKIALPATTFLLDINLYKDVLKQGKRYAIRVRAVSINPNSPVEIDNDGYSRIEAFQYGGSLVSEPPVPGPHDYFIQFKERKSGFWIDVYQRSRQKDTLVPIKEYIAFALTQNGIAYSVDAIELFLALNPELAKVSKVKISYIPNLPVYPAVSANDEGNFDKEHKADLEPDKLEENKFLKYLDTLNNYKQKIPENAVQMINDLVRHLNSIKPEISGVDRVTVNFINEVLSELLYELRLDRNANNSQYNRLQKLVTAIYDLTVESLNSTSLFYFSPEKRMSSFSSYQSGPNENSSNRVMPGASQNDNEIDIPGYLPVAIEEQLLAFDVIVWRAGTVAPYKPVLDAPDLKRTFRVFYTLRDLYNHKNPEVNAKTSPRLVSTTQISIPSNLIHSIWTLNMVNHKMTQAEDIDPRDVLKNSMKKEPRLKKPTIVIKVD